MADAKGRQRAAKIERIPPDGHPSWEEISAPILNFLRQGPKTWVDLDRFAITSRIGPTVFQNALAWLDNRGLVRSYYVSPKSDVVVWAAQSVLVLRDKLADISNDEVPKNSRKHGRRKGRHQEVGHEKVGGDPGNTKAASPSENTDQDGSEGLHGPPMCSPPEGGPPDMKR